VQGLPEMELAGLEPATSWVRSSRTGISQGADLQALPSRRGAAITLRTAGDGRRFSSFQALLATSAWDRGAFREEAGLNPRTPY
jgi:hypothetical protein